MNVIVPFDIFQTSPYSFGTVSNIAYPDPYHYVNGYPEAEWSAATAYALSQIATRSTTHRIYERLVAGTSAALPENDQTNWLDIGPANRFAMFDNQLSTKTRGYQPSGFIQVSMQSPGGYSLALFGIQSSDVNVKLVNNYTAAVYYDVTKYSADFYESYVNGKIFVAEESKPLVFDVPYNPNFCTLTVTISGGSGAECAVFVWGNSYNIGESRLGARSGITDFSKKLTDDFGVTTFVRRAFSKKLSAELNVPLSEVGAVQALLTAIRSTPCVWIPSASSLLSYLITFGWYRDFNINVQYQTRAQCTLEIEGLT
jgi:hypothetical protein